jgi:hypothetical protein
MHRNECLANLLRQLIGRVDYEDSATIHSALKYDVREPRTLPIL